MSTEVDTRVVEMRFDNAQFEKNVAESLKTLKDLKKNMESQGLEKSLKNIETSMNKFSMKNVSRAVADSIEQFSLFGVAGVTAMQRISNAAIDMGKELANRVLDIRSMKAGFSEYETQINAIQTILSNTSSKGTTIDQVNKALDELNVYADKTIYNFTQMTDNIGKFTAAGVGLNESVAAIKGISNLAALSGSDAAQAGRAMYNLSQALSLGTLKLQDWNSVVNAGMGGEIFQESLKETARVHGVAVDQMIAEEGSFRESLSKGWITAEILTETLQKFTGDLSHDQLIAIGYTEDQAAAIEKLGKDANDAATKVKTFTQLFDTLNEAKQSGWTQTWKIIVGDLEEARSLLTGISDLFGGIIEERANARNSFLEAVFGGDNGAGSAQEVEKQVTEVANHTKEELQRIVDEVWAGNWGNGEERWAALAEAGYDPVLVQSLVDLTELTENNQIDWENLTEEQLLSVGATEEQIEEFRKLNSTLQETSTSIQVVDGEEGVTRRSGRELMVEGLMNVLQGLVDIYHIAGEAWREVFPPASAETFYNLIVKFNEFTQSFKLNLGQTNAVRIAFKGLFDGVGLVVDVFGALFQLVKNIFGLFSKDDGEKRLTLLQRFAIVGAKISKFRSWLKDGEKLQNLVRRITDRIRQFIDFLKTLKDILKNIFFGGEDERAFGFEKLTEFVDKFKTKIRGIKFKPFSDFIGKVQEFLEKRDIKIPWLDELRKKIENLTLGDVIDGIKEKFNNFFGDFHPISTIVSWFEELTGIDIPTFEEIKQGVISKIDEIRNLFIPDEEIGEAPIVTKFKNWINSFGGIKFGSQLFLDIQANISGTITAIKQWFLGNDVTGEPGIVGKFKNWISTFTGINFDETWSTITENINGKIQEIVKWFSGDDIGETPGIIERIGKAIGIIRNWFDDKANFVINTEWFTGLKETIQSFVNWILGKDKSEELNLIVGAGFGIGIDPRQLEDNLTVENGPLQIFMNAIDEIKKWYEETDWETLFSSITTNITNKIDAIVVWFGDIKTAFENSAIGTSIKEKLEELKSNFENIDFKQVYNTFMSEFKVKVNTIKTWFIDVKNRFLSTEIGTGIKDKFNEFIENFKDIDFKEVYNNFISDFKSKVEGIKNWLNNIGDQFNFHPIETIKETLTSLNTEWEKIKGSATGENSPIAQIVSGVKGALEEIGSSPAVKAAIELIVGLPKLILLLTAGIAIVEIKKFLGGVREAIDTFLGGGSESLDVKANAMLKTAGALGIMAIAIGYLVDVFTQLEVFQKSNNISEDDVGTTVGIVGKLALLLGAMTALADPLVEWQGAEGTFKGKTITSGRMFKLGTGTTELIDSGAMMANAKAIQMVAEAYVEILKEVDVDDDGFVKAKMDKAGEIIENLGGVLIKMGLFQGAAFQVGIGPIQAMFNTTFGTSQAIGDLFLVVAIRGLLGVVKEIIRMVDEDEITIAKINKSIEIISKLAELLEELSRWSHISFGGAFSGTKRGGMFGIELGATASSGLGVIEYVQAIQSLIEAVKELISLNPEDVNEASQSLSNIMTSLDFALFGVSVGEEAADTLGFLFDILSAKKLGKIDSDKLSDVLTAMNTGLNSTAAKNLSRGAKIILFADAIDKLINGLEKLKGLNTEDFASGIQSIMAIFTSAAITTAMGAFLTFGKGLASIGIGLSFLGVGNAINGFATMTGYITDFLKFLIENGSSVEEAMSYVEPLVENTVVGLVNAINSQEVNDALTTFEKRLTGMFGVIFEDNPFISAVKLGLMFLIELAGEVIESFYEIFRIFNLLPSEEVDVNRKVYSTQSYMLQTLIRYGVNDEEYKDAEAAYQEALRERDAYYHRYDNYAEEYEEGTQEYNINKALYEGKIAYTFNLETREYKIYTPDGRVETLDNEKDFSDRITTLFTTGGTGTTFVDAFTGEEHSLNMEQIVTNTLNGTVFWELVINGETDKDYVSQVKELYENIPESLTYETKVNILPDIKSSNEFFEEFLKNPKGTQTIVKLPESDIYMKLTVDPDNPMGYTMEQIGTEIGESVLEGIGDVWLSSKESFIGPATVLGDDAEEALNEGFEKHSPSKIGVRIGESIDEGIGVGLVDNASILNAPVHQVASTFSTYSFYFYNAALDCVQGLIRGFSNSETLYNAANAATQLANTMLDATKTTLGIASPAKAFIEVGELSGEGIAVGLYNSMRGVVRAAGEMGTRAVSAVKYSMGNIGNSVMPLIGASASLSPVIDIRNLQNAKQTMARTFENGFWPTELMEQTQALKDEYNRSIYYDGFDDTNVLGAIYALNERIDQLDSTMSSMSMVLDSGALVGQLTPKVDKSLGAIARRKARGV